jgi:hypothetical protein
MRVSAQPVPATPHNRTDSAGTPPLAALRRRARPRRSSQPGRTAPPPAPPAARSRPPVEGKARTGRTHTRHLQGRLSGRTCAVRPKLSQRSVSGGCCGCPEHESQAPERRRSLVREKRRPRPASRARGSRRPSVALRASGGTERCLGGGASRVRGSDRLCAPGPVATRARRAAGVSGVIASELGPGAIAAPRSDGWSCGPGRVVRRRADCHVGAPIPRLFARDSL